MINEEETKDDEDVFDGINLNRPTNNPNSFYYRYLSEGGQPNYNRQWTQNEQRLFLQRAMDRGVNHKWGIFSKAIPGRVGYPCSQHWSTLIKDGSVRDLNFKNENGRMKMRRHDNVPQRVRRYSFIVFDDGSNTFENTPCFHPKFPSDNELLHYLNYIPVYTLCIDSFAKNQDLFCKYLVECNDLILPEMAAIIREYTVNERQIGWISDWAADVLAPLIRENKIKICTDPKSIKLDQLMIKRIGNEWPSELDQYCDYQQKEIIDFVYN